MVATQEVYFFWRVNDPGWCMYMRSWGGNAIDGGGGGGGGLLSGNKGWRICSRINDSADNCFVWENGNEDQLFCNQETMDSQLTISFCRCWKWSWMV